MSEEEVKTVTPEEVISEHRKMYDAIAIHKDNIAEQIRQKFPAPKIIIIVTKDGKTFAVGAEWPDKEVKTCKIKCIFETADGFEIYGEPTGGDYLQNNAWIRVFVVSDDVKRFVENMPASEALPMISIRKEEHYFSYMEDSMNSAIPESMARSAAKSEKNDDEDEDEDDEEDDKDSLRVSFS